MPVATGEGVIAAAALGDVVTGTTEYLIVTGPTVDAVTTCVARDPVVTSAAEPPFRSFPSKPKCVLALFTFSPACSVPAPVPALPKIVL